MRKLGVAGCLIAGILSLSIIVPATLADAPMYVAAKLMIAAALWFLCAWLLHDVGRFNGRDTA